MRQTRKAEAETAAIAALLDEIRRQYIHAVSMVPLILSGDRERVEDLRVIDFLHQSVLTSLQFGQYRRAVWYLQAFSRMCEKTFGESSRECVMETLQTRIKL